ncbi:hypothetical protein SAMN05192574_10738 [Mucilaginibacter gossypiicola]|uniref:MYXO-CTERM domain-containing protein n=1 Tax=Mucilaginibacter gossypiicola TaxID=551995 RepID=A0A1H8NPG4_9SPHI|nr:hypothetical protein [Mucilaginibacter gossypiicola]SEO31462.1 hypothetical protein SAMN05192574_10738 [Mucilaginibacter gossypiicola]
MAGKIYKAITIIAIFLLSIATVFAQEEVPCGGGPDDGDYDPNNCPLDTWVILLVVMALILTVIHLHRRRKPCLR